MLALAISEDVRFVWIDQGGRDLGLFDFTVLVFLATPAPGLQRALRELNIRAHVLTLQ